MRRLGVVARCLLLVVFGLLVLSALPVGAAEAPSRGLVPVGSEVGNELVGLRTAASRTYEGPGGARVARVFAEPVNFRDGSGDWRAIDTDLVAADGGDTLVNAANRFSVRLPRSIDAGPVRFSLGDRWVSFALQDASGEGVVEGGEQRFAAALPGVSVAYESLSEGLKETLRLSGSQAPDALRWRLDASVGLDAREVAGGGVELVDGNGDAVFSFGVPFAFVAGTPLETRPVDVSLAPAGDGWTLRYGLGATWLREALAEGETVVIDPGVSPGPVQECTLNASAPTTAACSASLNSVGKAGGERRTLMKFDVAAALPKAVDIQGASLAVTFDGVGTGAGGATIQVRRLTRAWTTAATWNAYNGTNAWTTAGGDMAATAESSLPVYEDSEQEWFGLGAQVYRWLHGVDANNGLALVDASAGASFMRRLHSHTSSTTSKRPYVGIEYQPRLGTQRGQQADGHRLSDRLDLSVNLATGGLQLRERDVSIAGVAGLDLALTRRWDSLAHPVMDGPLMFGWRLTPGMSSYFEVKHDANSVLWQDESGFVRPFAKKPGGGYESPPGVDATLTETNPAHTAFSLLFDKTGVTYKYSAPGDDALGRLAQMVDRNGNHVDFTYDGSGELQSITDAQGRELTVDWDGDSDDSNGQITSLTDWSGREWDYDYDYYYGLLTSYTNPQGDTTGYHYDGEQRIDRVTTPGGSQTKIEYVDSAGGDWRVKSITRVTDTVAGTGPKTQYGYSGPSGCPTGAAGTPTEGKTIVTDPRGKQTTYCWDTEGRMTKVTDPLGNARSATYDINADTLTSTAPNGAGTVTTTNTFTSRNLTQVQQPAGETATAGYANGSFPRLMTSSTSPHGTGQVFAYDGVGNLSSTADSASPAQVEAKLEYNGTPSAGCANDSTTKPGTIRCAIDGEGHETLYGYDDDGNLTSIIPELPLGATALSYDSLSRIQTVTDGKGQTRTYTYDDLDRVVGIDYSNGASIEYVYDEDGNLTDRTDSVHGSSGWSYDALNRRTQDSLPSGTTTYGYDAGSNLTALTDPGGTVSYGYDDASRLTSLAEPGGSCTGTVSLCTTFEYTDRDQRKKTTYPNGVVQTVGFDDSDKPTSILAQKSGGPVLTSFTYDYDGSSPAPPDSDLLQWVRDKDNNRTTYQYDFLGRLTSAVEKASDGAGATLDSRAYTYDKASNRKTQVVNGTTTTYAYNAANQLCWQVSGSSVNACGSPPSGATTYTYDANGNTTASSAGLAATYSIKDQTTNYTPPGGSAISFGYSGPGQVERTSVGGTAQHNTLLGLSRQGSTEWTRTPDGALISQNASGTRHYYLTDRLGSTVGLTDSSGAIANTYKYDPYGNLRSSSGSVANPFQYTGAHTTATGAGTLYKLGARYYQSALGRWTQSDPIDQAADLREGNRFAYAAADPINHTDLSGCSTFRCIQACITIYCDWQSIAQGCSGAFATGSPRDLALCIARHCRQAIPCMRRCLGGPIRKEAPEEKSIWERIFILSTRG